MGHQDGHATTRCRSRSRSRPRNRSRGHWARGRATQSRRPRPLPQPRQRYDSSGAGMSSSSDNRLHCIRGQRISGHWGNCGAIDLHLLSRLCRSCLVIGGLMVLVSGHVSGGAGVALDRGRNRTRRRGSRRGREESRVRRSPRRRRHGHRCGGGRAHSRIDTRPRGHGCNIVPTTTITSAGATRPGRPGSFTLMIGAHSNNRWSTRSRDWSTAHSNADAYLTNCRTSKNCRTRRTCRWWRRRQRRR